ncbi:MULTISPECIES: hypothetical protein [unclassified Mesorhizobium]|uniref:hypothetical protein n=1 Tax=unclassified Mesorhizobium TaxID=325217 RepID=UPI0015CCE05E|nr:MULTISPECIES: hypothetical protein [unclassified Mesorhizobium]
MDLSLNVADHLGVAGQWLRDVEALGGGDDTTALLDRFAQFQKKVLSRTGNQVPIVC